MDEGGQMEDGWRVDGKWDHAKHPMVGERDQNATKTNAFSCVS